MSSQSSDAPQEHPDWLAIESPSFRLGSAPSTTAGFLPPTLFPSASTVPSSAGDSTPSEPTIDHLPESSLPEAESLLPPATASLPNSEVGFTQLVDALCEDSSQRSLPDAKENEITQTGHDVGSSAPHHIQRDDTTLVDVPPLRDDANHPSKTSIDTSPTKPASEASSANLASSVAPTASLSALPSDSHHDFSENDQTNKKTTENREGDSLPDPAPSQALSVTSPTKNAGNTTEESHEEVEAPAALQPEVENEKLDETAFSSSVPPSPPNTPVASNPMEISASDKPEDTSKGVEEEAEGENRLNPDSSSSEHADGSHSNDDDAMDIDSKALVEEDSSESDKSHHEEIARDPVPTTSSAMDIDGIPSNDKHDDINSAKDIEEAEENNKLVDSSVSSSDSDSSQHSSIKEAEKSESDTESVHEANISDKKKKWLETPSKPKRTNSQTITVRPESEEQKLHAYRPVRSDGTGLPPILDKSPLKPFTLPPLKPSPFPAIELPKPKAKATRSKATGGVKKAKSTAKQVSRVSSGESSSDDEAPSAYDDTFIPDTISRTSTNESLSSRRSRRKRHVPNKADLGSLIAAKLILIGDYLLFMDESALIKQHGWLEVDKSTSYPEIMDWVRSVLVAKGKYVASNDSNDDSKYWKDIKVLHIDPRTNEPIFKESEAETLEKHAERWNQGITEYIPGYEFVMSPPKRTGKSTRAKAAKAAKATPVVRSPYSLASSSDEESGSSKLTSSPRATTRPKATTAAKPVATVPAVPASSTDKKRLQHLDYSKNLVESDSEVSDDDVLSAFSFPIAKRPKLASSTSPPVAKATSTTTKAIKKTSKASSAAKTVSHTTAELEAAIELSRPPKSPKSTAVPAVAQTSPTNAKKTKKATSAVSPVSAAPSAPVIVTSGLNAVMTKSLTLVVSKLGGKIEQSITDAVSHLVVNVDDQGLASRTFKYLEALLCGIDIVSKDWAVQSLKEGKYLPSKNFLVEGDSCFKGGPALAVTGKKQGAKQFRNSIFAGQNIFLHGNFDSPNQLKLVQLLHLLTLGGAVAKNIGGSSKVSPIGALTNLTDAIVICDEATNEDAALELALHTGFSPITPQWIIDSISHCKLVDTQAYLIVGATADELDGSQSW